MDSSGYFSLAWRSLIIGVSIAAPVGPIGVLCIRRTLAHGRKIGLLSGLGAATADMVYGLGAAFGLALLTAFLLHPIVALALRLIGGAFLVYLGVTTFRSRPADPNDTTNEPEAPPSAWGAYLSTFGLTITNPATILAFVAIFAGLGAGSMAESTTAAWVMVAGVTVGSALWWLTITGVVAVMRERVGPRFMRGVNVVSGLVLVGFGLLAMSSAFTGAI